MRRGWEQHMRGTASRRHQSSSNLASAWFLVGLMLALAATLVGLGTWHVSAAVTLVKFEAVWQSGTSILVVWETSSELDTTAYFLYRAESPNGPWDFYIDWEPAAGDEFIGASYSYLDREVTQGVTYYYRLEETTSDGSSNFFGPIMATGGPSSTTSSPTPTATARTDADAPPTATRQYTNTPPPASTTQGTTFTSPLPTPIPPRGAAAQPTPLQPARVTTPTPPGGVVESPPTEAVLPSPTPTFLAGAAASTATATLTATAAASFATATPTAPRLAAAGNATSQPLLDTAAIELAARPASAAAGSRPSPGRLTPLLGIVGGAVLAAAILLGTVAVIVWRARPR